MKLNKKCTCCGKMLTTKSVRRIGRDDSYGRDILYLNCNDCESTIVLLAKLNPYKKLIEDFEKKVRHR